MAGDSTQEAVEQAPETDKKRIEYSVDLTDSGPCRKRVKVTVPHEEVERLFNEEFTDLVRSAVVPGFRPGKTPRKLIERRFRKDVEGQVKSKLLMQTMEQIGDDRKVDPLSEPSLDFANVEIPEEGPFTYEFDVEVRPDFPLPDYKNMSLRRPVREISDAVVDKGLQEFLDQHAIPTPTDEPVQQGFRIVADMRIVDGANVISEFSQLTLDVTKELLLRDGTIEKFAEGLKGAKVGDSRELTLKLSPSTERKGVSGGEVKAVLVIQEVLKMDRPDVNSEFLSNFGVKDIGELKDGIRGALENREKHAQAQALRDQITDSLIAATNIELPRDLLQKQTERTLSKKVLELRKAGYSEAELRPRANLLRQDSYATTSRSLKEQFILHAIADAEKIEIGDAELDTEIEEIARQTGDSARRVRSRVQKENLWEVVATQLVERLAIERILSYAKVEDVAAKAEEARTNSSGVDASAIPEEAATEAASSEQPAGE